MGLFDAIERMAGTANAAPPGDPAGAETRAHANYHKWIVRVAGCCAVLGAGLGLLISFMMVSEAKSGRDVRGIILAPVMFGAAGFFFGMALMCLIAPRAFLTGPVGEPWMKLIGTRSVPVARVACLLFGLIVTLPLAGIGVLLALAASQ